MFSKFGAVKSVDMKRDYAFLEYDDEKVANDAIKEMDGKRVEGRSMIVQFAHGGRSRVQGPAEEDVCFNCGKKGHWYPSRH